MRLPALLPTAGNGTVSTTYTALCVECHRGRGSRQVRFSTELERAGWMAEHKREAPRHRVMVGEVEEVEEVGLQPIARVRHEDVGNPDSPDWRLVAAVASRTRTARLEHATWCMDHAGYYTEGQFRRVLGIYKGDGDPILQKCLEHGFDPE